MNRICACEHIRLGGEHGVGDGLAMAVMVVMVMVMLVMMMVAMVMLVVRMVVMVIHLP